MSIGKKITLILLLMLIVGIANIYVIFLYQNTQKHDAHIVNIAGRQRMLSQKITKLALSIANGDDHDRSLLKDAINLYGSSLENLWHGGYAMEKEISPAPIVMNGLFKKNEAIWQSFKEMAEIVFKEERINSLFANAISYVRRNSEILLKASDDVVTSYDTLENTHMYAHEINVAGRQRMLSQKISKHAFSIAAGFNVEEERDKLQKTSALYEESLLAMRDGGISIPWGREIKLPPFQVKGPLSVVAKIWPEFMKNLTVIQKDSRENKIFRDAIDYVGLNNGELLSISDEVTGQFDEIFSYKVFRLRAILFTMLGFDICIFFIGYALSLKIVRPLKELSIAATKIGGGNLENKMKISSRDEIGALGEAFNKMIDNLDSSRKELVSAKDYTDNILASMIDSLIVIDLDGMIRTVNYATLNLLGYREEELLGKPMSLIFKMKEEGIPKKTKIQELTEKGYIRDYKTKSGEMIPMSLYTPMMQNQKGKILGYVCVARDMRQINTLIIDIEYARSELEEWSRTLERKVDERTEELRLANQDLESIEQKTSAILKSIGEGIVTIDLNSTIQYANQELLEIFGYSFEELKGQHVHMLMPKKYRRRHTKGFKRYIEGVPSKTLGQRLELEGLRKDNSIFPLELRIEDAIIGEKNRFFTAAIRDITERKQTEDQIKASLKEKEILLREIYHRTKNNMAVICSLLNLQSKYTKDKKVLEIFKETENRIKSMSLVHTKLYQGKDLSSINLKSYIKDFTHGLFMAYQIDYSKIFLRLMADDIYVTIDSAIPCGLVINEIIVNSLKYAFPNKRKGEIRIELCKTDIGEIDLRIADNGIGMPKDLDPKNTDTFGLQIVTNLIEHQLKGKVVMDLGNGVEYRITFKEPDLQKRI